MKIKILVLLMLSGFFVDGQTNKAEERSISAKKQSSYSENVHMYICIEALKLLKDRFPNHDFSKFDARIGTMNQCGSRPWQVGTITAGACREDIEDVVYGIRGPFGLYASCTHFWNADDRTGGDHSLTHLQNVGYFPNSYSKMTKFISGDWHSWDNGNRLFIDYLTPVGVLRFSYHTRGLFSFYKTKRLWLESYINTAGQEYYIGEERQVGNDMADDIAFEIFGRMLHHPPDNTVAAHAHGDVHIPLPYSYDCYHEFIDEGGYELFTWQSAKAAGGFINPYEQPEDPMRYLLYTCNQIGDHYPSGPDCGAIPQEFAGDNNLPGGTYPILDNYYQTLGPAPLNIQSPYEEGTYCFNHAIRATAGMMYWIAVESGLIPPDPMSLPVINSFSKNLSDNMIYRSDTLEITCNASGYGLSYNWFYKTCRPENFCNAPIPGLKFISNTASDKFKIINTGFNNRWTCSFYDSLCNGIGGGTDYENPLDLIIGVNITNQWGITTQYYNFNTMDRFTPQQTLRPPPPPPYSGCPVLYVHDGAKYIAENDLLNTSTFERNAGTIINDKVIITKELKVDDNDSSVTLAVKETGGDEDKFDKFTLYYVDHPAGINAGITQNGDIVLYEQKKIVPPFAAEKSGTDVTGILKYDSLYGEKVTGDVNDKLSVTFKKSTHKNSKSIFAVQSKHGLIIDPEHRERGPQVPVAKDIAGSVSFRDASGNYNYRETDISKRLDRSEILICPPFNTDISGVELTWKNKFGISYAGIIEMTDAENSLQETQLISATDSKTGSIIEKVKEKDDEVSESDSTSYIELRFKVPEKAPPGMIRTYIFSTDGFYVKNDFNSQHDNHRISENIEDDFKLEQNFPNPFNPSTKISFNLKKAAHVTLKMYDVSGKEVATLADEQKESGAYELTLNAEMLSSGIYYYTFIVNGEIVETKRMVLLR